MNFSKIKKINAIATIISIISGIGCYKKYKLSNKNIFLFGIIWAAIGVTSGFYSAIFTNLAERAESSMSSINDKEEADND